MSASPAQAPGLTAWERISSLIGRSPYAFMAAGALSVSANAVFIDLSDTTTGTASLFRCLMALPVLALLGRSERSTTGGLSGRQRLVAVACGLMFAGDMLLWTQAILEVGAGLSTVLVNAQVVIVPLLALVIDKEALSRRYLVALPFMAVGVVLTGGIFETGLTGSDPVLGTVHALLAAVCYSGFLYLLRRGGRGGQDGRSGRDDQFVQPFRDAIVASAVVSLIVGSFWHGVDLAPSAASLGWLLLVALCGPIVGWLLVAIASPRLSSQTGAALLLLTPAGSLVSAAIVLDERPSPLQLVGCAVMLASAYAASSGERAEPDDLRPRE